MSKTAKRPKNPRRGASHADQVRAIEQLYQIFDQVRAPLRLLAPEAEISIEISGSRRSFTFHVEGLRPRRSRITKRRQRTPPRSPAAAKG